MALEDQFKNEDVEDIEARFEKVEAEMGVVHKRRIFDWQGYLEDFSE